MTISRSEAALKRYLVNVASPVMVKLAAVSHLQSFTNAVKQGVKRE
ncbi:MAG: hypothetical protein Q8R06_09495 [Polaromonas sp.]|nr:hypothetical protein [Polaromonas sp.]MDP3797372.1 hypothetical protein [Polaromonas sp.]